MNAVRRRQGPESDRRLHRSSEHGRYSRRKGPAAQERKCASFVLLLWRCADGTDPVDWFLLNWVCAHRFSHITVPKSSANSGGESPQYSEGCDRRNRQIVLP